MNKVINIEVTGLIATPIGAPVIVCGNSGYQVKFTFDQDWADITAKTARFVYVQEGEVKHHDVPFTGNTVDVPVLSNTKEVRVGVYAGEFSTSTPACVPCLLSIRCGSGTLADQPLTPSQYDEIMALFNDLPSESQGIPDGSIGTAKLANGAVTTEKIAKGSVTAEKLADDVTLTAEPADGSVGTVKLANGAVTAKKLANGAIDREDLFSFTLIEKFLSLPRSVVTSAGSFGASYFDNLTDPGIYEMGSQAGEQYALIVFKPETDYQRMQIRLSYNKIEYRGIYSDEAGVFNSADWEPWVTLGMVKDSLASPDYVLAEAESVANKVLDVRNADSFVFGAISDLHTTGTDASATGVLHAGQGMSEINNLTSLDMYAIFGDIMVDAFDDNYKEGFKFVKKSFAELSKSVPLIQMQGNHDELSTDTTEEAQQKYYAYIGANNIGVVTDFDNKYRNYGYRDFDNYKMRVIYLNSADVSSDEIDINCYVTAEQLWWLVNTALDFSDKDDSSEWGIIVMSHHPLNWNSTGTMTGNMWAVLNVLDNYKGKTSGTANIDDVAVTWDFSNATAELIAHFHGHLHNFRVETLGANRILSLTVPNACFGRENEYGSFGGDVAELYGDADTDGNQRVFTKTSNTANDTAFNIVTVDRLNRKIYAHCYGAGIDRVWTFEGEQLEGGGNVVVEPQYTNQIPISTNTDGSLYGYVTNTRLNSSGNAVTAEGLECTGFIPCKYGDVVRFANMEFTTDTYNYLNFYDSSKTLILAVALASAENVIGSNNLVWTDGNLTRVTVGSGNSSNDTKLKNTAFIRVSATTIDDTSIVTVNEAIA